MLPECVLSRRARACCVSLCCVFCSPAPDAHLGGDSVIVWVSVHSPAHCGAPLPSQRGPGACALCALLQVLPQFGTCRVQIAGRRRDCPPWERERRGRRQRAGLVEVVRAVSPATSNRCAPPICPPWHAAHTSPLVHQWCTIHAPARLRAAPGTYTLHSQLSTSPMHPTHSPRRA